MKEKKREREKDRETDRERVKFTTHHPNFNTFRDY